MKGRRRTLTAILVACVMLLVSACATGEKIVDRKGDPVYEDRYVDVEKPYDVPDSINVENIVMKKGESKEIAVTFIPAHAYTAYAFSIPIDRQGEITIKNGVITALKASDMPITVTAYATDDSLDIYDEFTVTVNGYFDPSSGPIYAFNRAGSFDYPVPSTSLDPAATGWTVTKHGEEEINTLTLSHYDLEEEARDPNSTRWAPRYSHEDVVANNVKIFDPFEFDVTFSRTLVNVPAGTWHFSMYMEGNNVGVTWGMTGTKDSTFSIASVPTWYYKDLVLTEPTTVEFSLKLLGETTNPDDSTSSPWVFFDSVRAINELAVEKEDDTAPSVVESAWTNYVVDAGFGAAESNTPVAAQSPDYPWKVGETLNTTYTGQYVSNVVNAPDVVTSDTNFQVDANGKSGKFKTTTANSSNNNNHRFTVYQDLTGVPHNFYTFSGYFMGGPDSIQSSPRTNGGLRLFVTYKDITGATVTKFKNVTVQSYFEGYIQTAMDGIEIVDGNVRIGFDFCRSAWANDSTDCWFQFDDFSFAATNELNDEDIDIFNTGGLMQLLGFQPDLTGVDELSGTGFTGSGNDASAAIDTTADNQAVGEAKTVAVTATAATTYTLTQDVAVTSGVPYVFSALVKSDIEFEAYVSAGANKGTTVTNASSYMQTYVECTPTSATVTLTVTVKTFAAGAVYFDWIIFADATVSIAVDDVVDMWVGDSISPFVRFIPSSKAQPCTFEFVSQSVAEAFTVSTDGVVSALKAGTAVLKVTHEESGATTTFNISAIERPLLTAITVEDKESLVGGVISTKLLLVTKEPATAIMGAVTYAVDAGSASLASLTGTRLTMLAPGVATINVTALDVNGNQVTTSFTVLIRTVIEAETLKKIATFNSGSYNADSFTDGGWTVVSNSVGTKTFTAANIFGKMSGVGSGIWAADGQVDYDFKISQTLTGLQAGTYTFKLTTKAAFNGVVLTAGLGDQSDTYTNANSSAENTLELTYTVEADGGSLEVWFSLTGTVTASNRSVWGDGVTAISLAKE